MNVTCSQCKSPFQWRKEFCPRCAARNEQGPSLIAGRIATVALLAMSVALTIFLISKRDEYTGVGNKPMPTADGPLQTLFAPPAPATPPDPRFGSL